MRGTSAPRPADGNAWAAWCSGRAEGACALCSALAAGQPADRKPIVNFAVACFGYRYDRYPATIRGQIADHLPRLSAGNASVQDRAREPYAGSFHFRVCELWPAGGRGGPRHRVTRRSVLGSFNPLRTRPLFEPARPLRGTPWSAPRRKTIKLRVTNGR